MIKHIPMYQVRDGCGRDWLYGNVHAWLPALIIDYTHTRCHVYTIKTLKVRPTVTIKAKIFAALKFFPNLKLSVDSSSNSLQIKRFLHWLTTYLDLFVKSDYRPEVNKLPLEQNATYG